MLPSGRAIFLYANKYEIKVSFRHDIGVLAKIYATMKVNPEQIAPKYIINFSPIVWKCYGFHI